MAARRKAAPPPSTPRLCWSRFKTTDEGDLAALLADPDITRNITANGSSPALCSQFARRRIDWHNSAWESKGYGVWALRLVGEEVEPPVIGWCGFCEAEEEDDDPEILYGLAKAHWGQGLGLEAAQAALDWLFDNTDARGASAIISSRLNPASVRVVEKLGMKLKDKMPFEHFLGDVDLARDVLQFEIWRLREGWAQNIDELIFQCCYRAGQLTTIANIPSREIVRLLLDAHKSRFSEAVQTADTSEEQLHQFYEMGRNESWMERYYLNR